MKPKSGSVVYVGVTIVEKIMVALCGHQTFDSFKMLAVLMEPCCPEARDVFGAKIM